MPAVLSLKSVAKRYGRHPVLRDVSFSLEAGECVAVMGPNRSGKSTLLRVAAGLTPPSGGAVRLSVRPEYVPDTFPRIDLKLSTLLKALRRIDGADVESLARSMGLEGAIDESVRNFSKGMLSKVAAIQALAAKTRLLLLDEPVSGQDEPSRQVFYREVHALMRGGTAVLLACHDPALVRALGGRALHLKDGALTAENREGADRCLCAQCDQFRLGLCGGREGFRNA
jgi:ABC-type multidrug transport system ATPase subunit